MLSFVWHRSWISGILSRPSEPQNALIPGVPGIRIGFCPKADAESITSDSKRDKHGKRLMPTVLRVGPYRFFFYAGDGGEPPHAHVERDDSEAKIWLDPVRLERSGGFSGKELRLIEQMTTEYHQQLMDSWHDFFNG